MAPPVQWTRKLARRVVDRKAAEERYYGAELGVAEIIQGIASVCAMIYDRARGRCV
jgi:hypothetical protein